MLVPMSVWLLREVDPCIAVVLGLSASAAAHPIGTQPTHAWVREHCA
ncbi:putative transport protein (Permease) (fragment) [Bradyrhizobium sp. ORS 375]